MDATSMYQLMTVGVKFFQEEQALIQRRQQQLMLHQEDQEDPDDPQDADDLQDPQDPQDPGRPRRPRRLGRPRRRRRWWVKPWMTVDRRLQHGHFDQLLSELRLEDSQSFANFVRLAVEIFDELLY